MTIAADLRENVFIIFHFMLLYKDTRNPHTKNNWVKCHGQYSKTWLTLPNTSWFYAELMLFFLY